MGNIDDTVQVGKPNVLIEGDASKYYNKYVAFADFTDKRIVAFGKDVVRVAREAKKQGVDDPVILYVHNPETEFKYIKSID